MKKTFFILILIFLVPEVRSEDEACYSNLLNYNSALLISRKWQNDLKDPKINPQDLCVWPDRNPEISAILKKNQKTSLIMINAHNKHVHQTKDFGFLDNEGFSSEVSDNELCVYTLQRPEEDATCELTSEYLKAAGESHFNVVGPITDFCKKNIDELVRRVRKCSGSTK